MTIKPQTMTYVVDGNTFELDTAAQRGTITAEYSRPVEMKLKDFLAIADVFRGNDD